MGGVCQVSRGGFTATVARVDKSIAFQTFAVGVAEQAGGSGRSLILTAALADESEYAVSLESGSTAYEGVAEVLWAQGYL